MCVRALDAMERHLFSMQMHPVWDRVVLVFAPLPFQIEQKPKQYQCTHNLKWIGITKRTAHSRKRAIERNSRDRTKNPKKANEN